MPAPAQEIIIGYKIAIEQIRPNPNQPRRVISQNAIDQMAESLKTIGQQTVAKVRPLTEAEKALAQGFEYELIGGHIRHAGALKAGLTTLDCQVLNLTAEQAEMAGLIDNKNTDMYWLDWVLAIERLSKHPSKPTQRELATQLGFSQARINNALQLAGALNTASRELLDHNVIKLGPENAISEYPIRALTTLNDPKEVEKLLSVVLDRQLTKRQVESLVTWVQAGNPAEGFDPKASKPAPKSQSPKPIRTAPTTEAEPVVAAHADSASESAQPVAAVSHSPKPNPDGPISDAETAAWEAVAGISVIAKIRSKIKKGERPNLFEMFLLAGHNLWRGLVWLVKEGFKLTKLTIKWTFKAVKMTWKLFRESLETFGLYKYIQAAMFLAIFIAIVFGAWYVRTNGTRATIHLLYSKIWHHSESPDPVASAPTSVPTPAPTIAPTAEPIKAVSVKTKPEVKKEQAPVNSQTSLETKAWVPDEETQTNLESEIASLPKNCVVEPLSFQPNTGINGAMAARRLQDLTDPDKYKLLFGHDVQKVMAIDADTTSMNITYQNGLIGFVTGGTSKMDFYWEDVRAIHCCQIESTDQPKGHPLYQCSLVLADAKRPFVIQCPSATNFGRLVSALVFWIQLSANKNVAVTGLPYLNQGLMMNDDRVITQVWAKSPADVAGLKCKDHLWSVGVNTRDPQDKKIILSALQGPSPITLFSVNPANWDKANIEMTMNNSHNFNPKRDKRTVS